MSEDRSPPQDAESHAAGCLYAIAARCSRRERERWEREQRERQQEWDEARRALEARIAALEACDDGTSSSGQDNEESGDDEADEVGAQERAVKLCVSSDECSGLCESFSLCRFKPDFCNATANAQHPPPGHNTRHRRCDRPVLCMLQLILSCRCTLSLYNKSTCTLSCARHLRIRLAP